MAVTALCMICKRSGVGMAVVSIISCVDFSSAAIDFPPFNITLLSWNTRHISHHVAWYLGRYILLLLHMQIIRQVDRSDPGQKQS